MSTLHFSSKEAKIINLIAEQFNKGNIQAGLSLFQENQNEFKNLSNAYLYMGHLAAKLKFKSISRSFLELSFSLAPSYESAIKLAESYFKLSKFSISSYYFEEAIFFKKKPLEYYGLARSYHSLGLNELAIFNFQLSSSSFSTKLIY